jgi:cytosine/adenosine deaminase-related metal-dependent hydrolase
MVYCPRTHAHFREQPHPFRQLLAQGTRVALGTDSRASNPDLDLLAEARFLHQQYPEVDCAALLRMATLSGAEALGWQAQTGSLSVGKSADLIVVPIEGSGDDPHRLVLGSTTAVQRVLYQGCWRG